MIEISLGISELNGWLSVASQIWMECVSMHLCANLKYEVKEQVKDEQILITQSSHVMLNYMNEDVDYKHLDDIECDDWIHDDI